MKYILLLLLLLSCADVRAQYKKAPPTDLSIEEPTNEASPELAEAGVSTLTRVLLRSDERNTLDSDHVYVYLLDKEGYVTESQAYDYDTEETRSGTVGEYLMGLASSRIRKGTRSVVERDAEHRVISEREYEVLKAGSYPVLLAAAEKKFPQQDDRTRDALQRFALEFIQKNRSDIEELRETKKYTYDQSGNLLSIVHWEEGSSTDFSYEYYKDGSVRVKRELFGGKARKEIARNRVRETYYTYTTDGKTDTIAIYADERDTGPIRIPSNLLRMEVSYYNRSGKPDSIDYVIGSYSYTKRIFYKGAYPARTIMIRNRQGRRDTSSAITHLYRDDHEVETLTWDYGAGKPVTLEREVIDYNSRGLPTQQIKFTRDLGEPASKALQIEQRLNFYGMPGEDAQTAAQKIIAEELLKKERREEERNARLALEAAKTAKAKAAVPAQSMPYEEMVFRSTEHMPSFDGDLAQYLKKNLRKPAGAGNDTVVTEFIVRTDGSLTDIKVINGAGKLLDEEAVRVVKAMPKWKPGKQQGIIVSVMFTLPIVFARK